MLWVASLRTFVACSAEIRTHAFLLSVPTFPRSLEYRLGCGAHFSAPLAGSPSTVAPLSPPQLPQSFLEEGLVEQFIPQPLDITTLFEFLKLFETPNNQYSTVAKKLSLALTQDDLRASGTMLTSASRKSMRHTR